MPSSKPGSSVHQRRIIWLAAIVIMTIGVYSVGWFYAARLLEEQATQSLADLNRGERQFGCENPQGRGYPFRIGLFCDRVRFDDPQRGLSIAAGALRSAAQVYAPRHIIGELDGPLVVGLTDLPSLQAGWSLLRASIRLAEPLPERISVEANDLIVAPEANPRELVRMRMAAFHMRPNAGNLDVALQFAGLTIDPALLAQRLIPPLDASADISFEGGLAALSANPGSLRGRAGTIRALSLAAGEGVSISMSGPASIGEDGLVNADLSISVNNPVEIARVLGVIFPEAEQQLTSIASGLRTLGNTTAIPIRIEAGRIFLGFIPTGRIAPLD